MRFYSIGLIGFFFGLLGHFNCLAMPSIDIDEEENTPTNQNPPQPIINFTPSKSTHQANPQSIDLQSNAVESYSYDGPNTVDESEDKIGTNGNWVKKKYFLMKSFDAQKEIEGLATQIQSYRTIYQQKFNAIDSSLESFYKQLGLDQSKVEELITSLNQYIDDKKKRRTERFKQKITDKREQQLAIEQMEEALKANKEELAQLKIDMKSIEELDKSINARIQKADEQISTAQQEAARTKDIINSMWDMLDDRKAKAAYFEIKDGIARRLQTISTYLQQDLLADLDKTAMTINSQIKKARDAIKNLEDKGFLIRERSKRLDELNLKKAKEAAEELSKIHSQQKKVVTAQKKSGFFTKIYDALVSWLARLYTTVRNFFGFTPIKKATIKPKVEPVPQSLPTQNVQSQQPSTLINNQQVPVVSTTPPAPSLNNTASTLPQIPLRP